LAAYLTFPFPCWSVFISNTGHVYLFASEDTTVLPTGHCLTSNYVVMTACSVPIALEFQHLLQGWGSWRSVSKWQRTLNSVARKIPYIRNCHSHGLNILHRYGHYYWLTPGGYPKLRLLFSGCWDAT
jgi:hypothetical protein